MIVLCLNRMLTPVVLESEMISFIARSSGTAQLAALRQTVPSGIVPPALGYNTTEKILVENLTQTHTPISELQNICRKLMGYGQVDPKYCAHYQVHIFIYCSKLNIG